MGGGGLVAEGDGSREGEMAAGWGKWLVDGGGGDDGCWRGGGGSDCDGLAVTYFKKYER